ncbi:hypothetical protein L1987_84210 [Smallanthus sonchifolius]|uniref:Uncharacterized protein n=1 Tax=Smallanthus sonchifolius TaxID=185202 RepID=A0ACB8YE00_9ASTR|nr:hypothetical protein L1987_84210 [Smallanthus sonchifolius]
MLIKMACFQGLGWTFIVLMIVGTVKGRWLDLEPYPTMISDGIHEINTRDYLRMGASNSSISTTTLYDEKRCESIYGFLPCADTMAEGAFLMILYTGLMMLGEEWIRKGSQALFLLLGDYKVIGAGVFRLLMAFPRIVLVIVAGIFSTESAAQSQVAFGVSMYAGSTFITLTFLWGFCIMLNRDKLPVKEPIPAYEHKEEDSSTKCLPLKPKLSILVDSGVKIDPVTGDTAKIMLISLIPFVTVELVALIKTPLSILFPFIVSGVSLVSYFAYQIWNPWIPDRSLAYLKEENLRIRFLYHIQRLAEDDLIDEHGNPNSEAFLRAFTKLDGDKDDCISHEELERLIVEEFKLVKDDIFKEYAKAEIFIHFDDDKSGKINLLEFQKGCTKWLEKCKNDANTSNSVSKNLWKQVEEVAIRKKRENLTRIEKIMPRILQQVLKNFELVDENGVANREKIEGLFARYDRDGDNKIDRDELKELIETLDFGVNLNHDTFFNELANDFDNDNKLKTMEKNEFIEGLCKWIDKAIKHEPSIEDPNHAIAKFDEDCWADIDTPIKMIYNGLVNNNLIGLLTLLATVYAKGLSWTYLNEVLTIVIPCIVVGVFALKRDTYPLWASIFAMLLYPIYMCLDYVFGS